MTDTAQTDRDATLSIVPANKATFEDIQAIFGTKGGDGSPAKCQCQRFKMPGRQWAYQDYVPADDRAAMLREQTCCDDPDSPATSGLVAYLDGEPVGWCAVEPRTAYPRLLTSRIPWTGRDEDKADPGVWAVTCFIVRSGYRRRGISYALAQAAVDFARERGARAVEGYSMITEPGKDITWGELHVGSRSIFAAAGFREISHPTSRRVVMRIDF